jgi:hypothetical protein
MGIVAALNKELELPLLLLLVFHTVSFEGTMNG